MRFLRLTTALGAAGMLSAGAGLFSSERQPLLPLLVKKRLLPLLARPVHAKDITPPQDLTWRLTAEKTRAADDVPPPAMNMEREFVLTRFGLPSDEHQEPVSKYRQFIMEYDVQKRTARWVLEHLNMDNISGPDRRIPVRPDWKVDGNQKHVGRPSEEEWRHFHDISDNLVRRQLVSPRNYNGCSQGFDDSFLVSNTVIVPKGAEPTLDVVDNYVRSIAKAAKNTYVVTGPLFQHDGGCRADYGVFGTKEWGPRQVSQPIAIYKVVLSETDDDYLHLYSFIVPVSELTCGCAPGPVTSYLCSFQKLKQLAAIDDFPNVPMDAIATINNNTNAIWSGGEEEDTCCEAF